MNARRTPSPVPVEHRLRAFPAARPRPVHPADDFPERVVICEVVIGHDGRAVCGAYVGDGPNLDEVAGRFLGPLAPRELDPPGDGPLRDLDTFLDRLTWRPIYKSRFGFVSWKPAGFFSSVAYTFRHGGLWAVVFTDPNPAGGRLVDYFRSPIIFDPKADGRVDVSFGPRKNPDPGDFDDNGRQYPGRFASLQDATSALVGEKVDDLATGCRLFEISPPPPGPATVETLPVRIVALRDLYRVVRQEADSWLV